ncbi:MAG: response regulator [Clostridia bacterium]|nr:response regulator [Clostridia bacterium]
MKKSFAETLHRERKKRNLSQQQLADKLFVDRSSVANWEAGRRMPDAAMISALSECLGVDVGILLGAAEESEDSPVVILVDNEKIILTGGLPVLKEVMPKAEIIGFTKPSDVLNYARDNRISLAFLDIEMGKVSGLDLCRELLEINPRTNVIFLTAYMGYSFDAWSTGACGFILKPISASEVRKQITLLRYPVRGLI